MNQLNVSLWGDESFTAVAVGQSFLRMLQIVAKDTAPPLYYLLLYVWVRIFGHSEAAIRSLSCLLYLGTILIVFLLVKKIWGKTSAFLALLLTVSNPFLFPFAFEGRMYSILVFTVTLSFYFFLTNNTLGYILASALAIYSHHYAVFAIFFQFFWRLAGAIKHKREFVAPAPAPMQNRDGAGYQPVVRRKPRPEGRGGFTFLKPYFFIGLLYLPWLYPLYKQVTLVSTGFWLGKPKLIDILGLIINYLMGGKIIINWQKYWPVLVLPILMIKKWRNHLRGNIILLGWIGFPLGMAFVLSQGKTSIFYDRYLIYIIPAMMMLMSGGLRKISPWLIIVFCLPLLWLNFYYFSHPTKRPFRELAYYIKQNYVGLPLINFNGKAHHLWEAKYYQLSAPLYIGEGELPFYVGTAQMTSADVVRSLPSQPQIGVIASEEPSQVSLPGFVIESSQQFGELRFILFKKQ